MQEPAGSRARKEFRVRSRQSAEDPALIDEEIQGADDTGFFEVTTKERTTCDACGRVLLIPEQLTAVCGFSGTELLCEVCGAPQFACSRPECQIRLCPGHRVISRGRVYCPTHGREERQGMGIAIVVTGALALLAFSVIISLIAQL